MKRVLSKSYPPQVWPSGRVPITRLVGSVNGLLKHAILGIFLVISSCGKVATKDSFVNAFGGTDPAPAPSKAPGAKALLLSSKSATSAAGICFGPITVTLVDTTNNPVIAPTDLSVNLAFNGSGSYYSDSKCSTLTGTVGITVGTNSQNFYFKGNAPGFGLFYANSDGLDGSLLPFDIHAGAPVSIEMRGPATLQAGVCSSAFTVSLLDQYGVITKANSDQTIHLGSGGAGSFYNDPACSVGVNQISVPTGTGSSVFYFLDPAGEILSLSSTSLPLASTTLALTVNAPLTPTKLQLSSVSSYGIAGHCAGPITITTTDASGNVIAASSAITVSVSSSGTGSFYSNSGCSTVANSTTVAAGSSSASIYFQTSSAQTQSVLASASGLAGTNLSFAVVADVPSALLLTGPASPARGSCSSAFVVALQDSYGNTAKAVSATPVNLSGAGSGSFYTNSGCSNSATSITISPGNSNASFYFKDPVTEGLTLTAISAGLSTGTLAVTLTGAPVPTKLALSSSAGFAVAGVCTPLTVTTTDTSSNPLAVSSNVNVNYSNTGNGNFYSDSSCTVLASTGVIATATSAGTIYFSSTLSQTQNLIASATGFSSNNYSFSVVAAIPSQVTLTGVGSLANSSCSPVFNVGLADSFGNIAKATAPTTINLTGAGSGVFYSNSSCSVSTTSTSVAVGNSSATFYLSDALGETLNLSGASGGLTAGTLAVVVSPSATATKLLISSNASYSAAGTCYGPITVTTTTSSGSPIAVTSPLTVNISNTGSGSFYTSAGCGSSASSLTINTGFFQGQLYFKSNLAENQTFLASATAFTGSSLPFSVLAAAPSVLSLSGPANIANAACSTAYTITLKDAYSNTAKAASPIFIALSGGGSGTFFSDSSCASNIASAPIVSGASSSTFYFKDLVGEVLSFNTALAGLTSGVLPVSVAGPINPTKLAFSSVNGYAVAGVCTPVTVTTTDNNGSALASSSITNVSLSNTGNGGFYSDAGCTTSTSSLSIPAGTTSGSINFKSLVVQSQSLVASAAGLASSNYSFAVIAGSPSQISISGVTTLANATCSSPFSVTLQDANGNTAKATGATSIALSGGGGGTFYSNSLCTNSITSITIGVGASTASVYFKDSVGENISLIGASAGLSSGAAPLVVAGVPAPTKLALTSVSGFAVAGVCTQVTASTTDASGNPLAVLADLSVSFSATGNGSFFSDSGCSIAATTRTITSGTSSGSLYFLSTLAQSESLIVAGSGLATYNYPFAVVAAAPVQINLTGVGSLANSVCSPAFTLTLQDAGSNTAKAVGPVTLNLSGVGAGLFYSNSGCTSSITTVSIGTGSSTGTFYVKDATGEALTLAAASAGLTGATLPVTVSASATATALAFSVGATFTGAGTCAGPFTITTTTTGGSTVAVGADLTVSLSNTGSGSFYTTNACNVTTSSATVTSGSFQAQIYFKDTIAENQNLLASASSFTGATLPYSILPAAPSTIVLTGPSSLSNATCSTAYTLSIKDSYGNLSKVVASTTLSLAGGGAGTFYSNSNCTTSTASVIVLIGSSAGIFYYKNGTGETDTFTVSNAGLTSGTLAVTTTGVPAPTKLALTSSAGFAVAGVCTQVTVNSTDNVGTLLPVAADTVVNFSATGSGGFFSTGTCGVAASSVTLTAGTSSNNIYFRSNLLQNQSVIGSATGLVTSNYPFPVVAAAPTQISMTGVGTLANSACSAAFTLTLQDAFSNSAKAASATTITLSGGGSGTFYSSAGCTTASASAVIASGTSSASFYFKDTTGEALTFTGANAGLTSGTLSVTISPTATATTLALSAGASYTGAGTCFGPLLVTSNTTGGSPVAVTSDLTVNLSNSGSGSYYTTNACTVTTTTATITNGTFQSQVYFKSTLAENQNFLASATSFTGATLPFTILAGAPSSIVLAGPANISNATCSSAYTLTFRDGFANAAKASGSTSIALTGGGSGLFYSNSNCSTAITTVAIASGNTTGTFYFKDATGESLTLTSASAGLTNGTLAATVATVLAPTKLTLTSSTGFAVAGVCTQLTAGTTDNSGTAIAVGADTSVAFSGSGNGSFFSNNTCTVATSSATVLSGTSSGVIYFKSTLVQSQTVSASASGLTSFNYPFPVVAGAPAQIALTGVGTLANSACSAAFTLTLQDSFGNTAKAGSTVSNALTGGGSGTFYSESSCTTASGTVSITSGYSSGTFYFKDSAGETLTLSAAAAGLTSGILSLVVNASATATTLALSASASFTTDGTCFGPINVITNTTGGTPVAVGSNLTVALSNTGSGIFYTTNTCVTTATSVVVSTGTYQSPVYFKTTLAENQTFLASATSFTGASMPFSILAGAPAKIALSGPTSLTNATCSSVYTLTLQDANANTAKATSATAITLGGGGSGTFYSNSNCTTSVTTASIGNAGSTANFYFKDGSGEALSLTGTSAGLTTGTLAISVASVATPTKLALSSASGYAAAGVCTLITATTTDNSGAPLAVTADTLVTFANSGSGGFYSDAGCTTGVSTKTVTSGSSSGSVYLKSTAVQTPNLTASAPGLTSISYAFSVIAAAPSQIILTGVGTLSNASCSSAFTVTLQDIFANTAKAIGSTSVALSGGGSGTFYSNVGCTTSSSTVVIATGNSSGTFYFKDTTGESLTLAGVSAGLTTGNLGLVVSNAATATTLALSSGASFTTAGTCYGPITVTSTTSGGSPIAVGADLTVSISNTGSGSFYTSNACTSSTSSLTITNGTYQTQVYFKTIVTGSQTLLASATSFTGANLAFSVLPGAPAAIAVTGSTTLGGGTCSPAYTVSLIDSYGNLAKAAGNTVVSLSGAGAGTFYSNSSCSSAATSVTVLNTASIASYYYQDPTGETVSLTGTNGGLTSGAINVTVSAPAVATQIFFTLASGYTNSGNCFGPVTIQTTNSSNTPIAPTTNKVIALSGAGLGSFYTAIGCATTTTSATVTAGTTSTSVYFKDLNAENLIFSGSEASLTTGTYPFSVQANPPSSITITGSGTLAAGTCSSAMTVQLVDSNSNPSKPAGVTTVNLTGGGSGTFYSNSGCTANVTSVSIGTTVTSAVFYFKDTASESLTLNGAGTSLSSGSLSLSVTAGAASKLALAKPANATAGICSGALSIVAKDLNNNTANVSADAPVSLSGQGSSTFYSDSGCGTSITSLTVLSGTSSTNFYVKGTAAATLNLVGSSTGYISAVGTYTIGTNTINKWVITGPASGNDYTCTSTPFTVTSSDTYGNAVNEGIDTVVTLGGMGAGGGFYVASDCSGGATTTVTVTAGNSSTSYYFKSTAGGSLSFTATGGGLTAGAFSFTSIGLAASQLALTGTATGTSNHCSPIFTTTSQDNQSHTTAVSSDTLVNLSGQGQGKFYSDSGCVTPITAVTITNAQTAASFYYKNQSGAAVTLTAAASGLSPSGTFAFSQTPTLTSVDLVAGSNNLYGYRNSSVGSQVRFNNPGEMATDGTYVYVADQSNNVIRKFNIATGAWSVFVGSSLSAGSANGTGTIARFNGPIGLVVLGANLYVADFFNQVIRKVVLATGVVTLHAGALGATGTANGTGGAARFNYPYGMATDGTDLFVSDYYNNCIRRVTTAGVVTTLSGTCGSGGALTNSATAASNRFSKPASLAVDGTNTYLFVADSNNYVIRQITISNGTGVNLAGSGSTGFTDGTGAAATFYNPFGLAIQGANLFVGDSGYHLIRSIVIATGAVTTVAGSNQAGWGDGSGGAVVFNTPRSLYSDGTNLWISDLSNHSIRKMNISNFSVSTFAGPSAATFANGKGQGNVNGALGISQVSTPSGLVEVNGALYIVDQGNCKIRKLLLGSNVMTTFAGSGTNGTSLDGSGTAATFNYPRSITSDGTNLFVTEQNGDCIRKIAISTAAVTTLVGLCGTQGSTDSATAANVRFGTLLGITIDASKTNLYVPDYSYHSIRKVVIATGATTTFAGTSGSNGTTDATGAAARFYQPWGITTDGVNLYVADNGSLIRQITLSGAVVTTLAGQPTNGYTDATGTAAQFRNPQGITNDGTNLYVSDLGNHVIRKIVINTGVVTTYAGSTAGITLTPERGSDPDNAVPLSLDSPDSIYYNSSGLFFGESSAVRLWH